MSSREYQPSELPAVDRVEVVLLRDIHPGRVSAYMREAEHAPRVVLSGSDADLVAASWRALPAGEPARCHVPTYGLRFIRGGAPILEASICWECNNAFGHDAVGDLYFEFDASAAVAQQLLQLLIATMPTTAP